MQHGDNRQPAPDVAGLVEEARRGSAEALGRLLEACRPYLLLVANQQLPPGVQGKVGPSDLVQETFLKAQGGFNRFQGRTQEELLAWLREILINTLLNAARFYQGAEKRHAGREVPLETDDSVEALRQGVTDPGPSPSEHAVAREETDSLEQALARLPELYRQVLHWRSWERRPFEEIGRLLGRSPEAARKLWIRAVEQLQRSMRSPDAP